MLGGLAALGLDDRLGGSLVWAEPTRVVTGVVVAVLAILAAWVLLAIDGGEHAAWAAVPPVLAGASLGVGLAVALNPAAVLGLATAGLLSWTTAGIAAGAGLIASAVGAYAITLVTRRTRSDPGHSPPRRARAASRIVDACPIYRDTRLS